MHFDYVTRPRRRTTEIAGTEGILQVDLDRRRLSITGHDGESLRDEIFDGTYDLDFKSQMSSFLTCMRRETTPSCSTAEALSVLELVLAARRLAALPS